MAWRGGSNESLQRRAFCRPSTGNSDAETVPSTSSEEERSSRIFFVSRSMMVTVRGWRSTSRNAMPPASRRVSSQVGERLDLTVLLVAGAPPAAATTAYGSELPPSTRTSARRRPVARRSVMTSEPCWFRRSSDTPSVQHSHAGSEGAGFRERGDIQRGVLIVFFERRRTAADVRAACASSGGGGDELGGGDG